MDLLKRTRRLFQGLSPPSPARVQYYSVTCPDGHPLSGERTEGYQALRCPACGEGIFVLPKSPFPEPPVSDSPRPSRKPRAAASHAPDGPIELTDPVFVEQEIPFEAEVDPDLPPEPSPAPEAPPERRPVRKRSGEPPARRNPPEDKDFEPPVEAASPPQPGPKAKPKPAAPRPRVAAASGPRPQAAKEAILVAEPRSARLAAWASRRRNPLIFVAVTAIVLGTVGVRLRRARLQDLPRVVEAGRVEGLAALDAGKFDAARQLLSEADRAVSSLGGAVEGAAEIRQGAGEAAILTSLAPDSLEAILADASADPRERASRFASLYKGRSIIVDAHITAVPDAAGQGRYELDYRILPAVGGAPRPRVGRIDLAGVRLFEGSSHKVGDRVVFGARLASLDLDESERWWFGLEPDGAIYMTHTRALQALGWPDVDAGAAEERHP